MPKQDRPPTADRGPESLVDHVFPLNNSSVPLASPATQKVVDVHETASIAVDPSMVEGLDHAEPVKICACPLNDVATQKAEDGHDTALGLLKMVVAVDHAVPLNV